MQEIRNSALKATVPESNLSTIMTGGTMGNENGVTHLETIFV